jgi:type II secretory pathway pseudopilin PulG
MKRKSGLTLVELVLMIAISSVLLISLSRAVQALIESQVVMRDTYIALNLAKLQMAKMNNAAYPAAGTTNPTSAESFTDFGYTQVVTEIFTSGGNSVREIYLDVTRAGEVLVRLYTYRTNAVNGTTGFGNGA